MEKNLNYILKIKIQWHLLIKYLIEIDHAELIDKSDKIQFLYNARQINFGDRNTVRKYFHNVNNPVILVMDINNLLSNNSLAKQNVIFLDESNNQKVNVVVNIGTTIEQLIKMYLYKVGGLELIDDYYSKKNICFFYDHWNISSFGEETVEKFLSKGDPIPIKLQHLN